MSRSGSSDKAECVGFNVSFAQLRFWCCWCQVTSVQMNGYCELNYSDFRVVAYSEENMAADAIGRKDFKMADYRTCTVYFTRMDLQSSIRLLTSQYPQFVILLCFLYVGCPDHTRA